ncbi:hypothetical protein ACFSM5_15340 [Lacibacterium aquatile]|uniref:Uncharacterized protein n=1 Tax=Lacibacterium aquatile TaxID=1168082 RepID=A0ABW5DXV2_9PROT
MERALFIATLLLIAAISVVAMQIGRTSAEPMLLGPNSAVAEGR